MTIEPKPSLRNRLLKCGIERASLLDGRAVDIDNVVAKYHLPADQSHQEFPTNEAYRAELLNQCTQRLNSHIADAWTNDPENFEFDRAVWRFARGFHEFGTSDKRHFAAFSALAKTSTLPQDFNEELDVHRVDPALVTLLEITREYMRRINAPADPWLCSVYALTLYSAVYGITHLNTHGVTRFLSKTGQKQLLNCLVSHAINACRVSLPEGKAFSVAPHVLNTATALPNPAQQRLEPGDPVAQLRKQLFEGGVKVIYRDGLSALTIERSAEAAGMNLGDAQRILLPDRQFEMQVSDYLGARMKAHLLRPMGHLSAQPHPFELGKSAGVAYVGMALTEPEHFDVHTILSTRSIVPTTFEQSPENQAMGQGFELLLDVTRQGIEIGGGQRSSWTLFETTMNLWATSHGLGKLLSNGPLYHLPKAIGHDLIDPILNASTTSAITRLGLTAPGITDRMVPVVRNSPERN